MTPEKLDEYRELVKFGSHLGVGGQALQLLLAHIDTLNEVSQAQGRTGIALIAERDALEADRDQISLTLDVAKADRDKWFNRARDLEKALREAIPAFNTTRIIMNSQEARDEAGEMVTRWRAVLEGSALETGAKPVERTNVCKHYATVENCPLCSPKSEGGKQ